MLSETSVVVGWSWTPGLPSVACERSEPWRELDRQLRAIAKRRAALDAEELGLIREAVRVQLWRPLAMTSLDALPAIEAALETGDLSYSAVRELTRIATRKTEDAWVKACRGKNLRQIEELVAEREVGDAPTSKPKPQVCRRKIAWDLKPTTYARLREARKTFEAERGERLDDDELMSMLLSRALEDVPAGKTPKPRREIAVTICRACKQGWQTGGGREIPISAADVECAMCDAEVISLERPGRATKTIPAATRKAVMARDHHRCTVPGCRSARNLDVHHIVHRAHGGTHEPENLTVLCDGHHTAHHEERIVIRGRAPDIEVIWSAEVPHVGDSEVVEQVRSVLRNLASHAAKHEPPSSARSRVSELPSSSR